MTQSAKAQEPSMEEILASIRRIIADDDANRKPAEPPKPAPAAVKPVAPPKPAAAPPPPPPKPVVAAPPPPPPEPAATNTQDDIDAMLADLDAPPVKPEPDPDVLDLTEAQTTPVPGPAPSFRTIDGESDIVFSDHAPEPPPAPPPPPEPEPSRTIIDEARFRFAEAAPERALLSNAATAAVDSAFNALAHTVLVQNARTLEDLVKEMLRPMLKAWLDDNLPNLVERIVRMEIERVSRGRS